MDGHDYSFEVDYLQQWHWLVEGVREAARHRSDIRISIEYKPYESRNAVVVPDVGHALHLCHQVGLPNVGITVDVGHALGARETPAKSLVLAHDAGRLFYVHFNDNDRGWDWDMLPASVNLWDVIEMLYYLDRCAWDGWFAYDVFTRHGTALGGVQATLRIMDDCQHLLQKIGPDRIREMIASGDPASTFQSLMHSLL